MKSVFDSHGSTCITLLHWLIIFKTKSIKLTFLVLTSASSTAKKTVNLFEKVFILIKLGNSDSNIQI